MSAFSRLFSLAMKTVFIHGLILLALFWWGRNYRASLWDSGVEPYRLVVTFEPFVGPADAARALSYNGLAADVHLALADDFNARELTIEARVPSFSLTSGENWKKKLEDRADVKEVGYKLTSI